MARRSLVWRIWAYFFLSTLGALFLAAHFATRSVHTFHQEQVARELEVSANLVARRLAEAPAAMDPADAERLCKDLAPVMATRITVILPSGVVAGDSEREPSTMENHADRPEFAAALAGGTGRSVRYSDTLRRNLMYVAVPLRRDGAVGAIVRASRPLADVDAALQAVYLHILAGAAGIALLFALIAAYISRRISQPLQQMRLVAERLARGDLAARVGDPGSEEVGALAASLNLMAEQLDERLRTMTRQRNELDAVLSSMIEGVLAVDSDQRIVQLNASAARLLDLDPKTATGRSIPEAVRHPDLQRIVTTALQSGGTMEGEITLHAGEDQVLQIQGTALADAAGVRIGVLVVLHDITRLKRLEVVRRDFVANVSHELKTPITAMKGCVDTLAGGALAEPAEAQRFLAMLGRHVDRLAAILEDLLSLSRLEADAEQRRVALATGSVGEVLRAAVQNFATAAAARQTTLAVDCPDELAAPINAPLLEQAVGNLLDNAIKYSPAGSRVTVKAAAGAGEVAINVADEGPGIEKKHLPRIFERFYRVDQARSRALGGTGLGLAIVRHIVLAHGGTVGVVSTPGRGSTFTIRLPR